jgi:uncharacterized protein (DUF305 family)
LTTEHRPVANAAAEQQGGDIDRAFIDVMVPHHQSAVEMAKLALERAEHDELRRLASDIIAAQEREIAQMREWRREWFGSDKTPSMGGHALNAGRGAA